MEIKKIDQLLAADEDDEHDYFSKSIGKRLKKLTPHKAAFMRMEIEKFFFSVESASKIEVDDL